MKILVLGGNGFIGQAICQKLAAEGHCVHAWGRNIAEAGQRLRQVVWRAIDIGTLTHAQDWRPLIAGMDAVINCAGALQDSGRDNLAAVQRDAMLALYQAAEQCDLGIIIQISAAINGKGADVPFIATKLAADCALAQSKVAHIILRPALVVGRNAHGGTALIRSLASFPLLTPLIYADSPVQTIALSDLTKTVCAGLDGTIEAGSDLTLAAPQIHTLAETITAHRAWLGLKPAPILRLPQFFARITGGMADCAGFLGWRSPLRSTAMAIMSDGVALSHSPGAQSSLPEFLTLAETLNANPAGVQDLWFARLYLLKPLIILTLALFWIVSGAVAFWSFDAATAHVAARWGETGSAILTVVASLADILLGCLVVFHRHALKAMSGMLALSTLYLIAGTLIAPELWVDPLGPYVKIFPSVFLTLAGLATFNER